MGLQMLWLRHKDTLWLSLLLFIASSGFVQGFADLAVSEFGAASSSLSNACKWDCGWYASIVRDGYQKEPGIPDIDNVANWAFFPVFPLMTLAIKKVFGFSIEIALVVTSKFFLFMAISAFMALVERELGEGKKLLAGMLVAFNPYIIYAHVGYTEPLYFFLSSVAFSALGRGNWLMAGLVAGGLSATRVVGVLFVFPYLIKSLSYLRSSKNDLEILSKYMLGLLLLPLGLGLYMLYLHFHMGDALAFSHIQVAWARSLHNPLENLWIGLIAGGRSTYMAFFALLGLLMSGWLLYKCYYHYAIFLMGVTLLPLATGLESLPRYVMWQVPFLFGLVLVLDRFPLLKLVGGAYATGIGGFIVVAWFSGQVFVT